MSGSGFVNTLMLASGARDVAFNLDQSKVFVAQSDGKVSVFNATTGVETGSWTVGTSLGAMSLSDDGAYLLVLERTPPTGTGVVYRVDTATGATTTYSRSGGNFLDVEAISATKAVLTGVGSNYLTVDITNGSFASIPGGVHYSTQSYLVESGTKLLFSEGGISSGPLATFDETTNQFVADGTSYDGGVSGFNFGLSAISQAAGLTAQFIYYQTLNIYDANLDFVRTVDVGSPIDGIAFDSTGSYLYVHRASGDLARFDTNTWTETDRYTIDAGGWSGGSGMTNSELIVSTDGKRIVLRDPVNGDARLIDFSASTANDTVTGTTGADTMAAGDGDDIYTVNHAGDVINELIYGGNDRANSSINYTLGAGTYVETLASANPLGTAGLALTGNELGNTIIGDAGANLLDGKAGDDRLDGGNGNDTLLGGDGNDTLLGGAGDDLLNGGAGDDRYMGGDGTDTVTYAALLAGVTVDLGLTTRQSMGAAGFDSFTSIENIVGTDYADTLTGTSGANTLTGGMGNDTLDGKGGLDVLDGGDGDDLFVLSTPVVAGSQFLGGGWTDTIRVSSAAGSLTVGRWSNVVALNSATLSSIEVLELSTAFSLAAPVALIDWSQASTISTIKGTAADDTVIVKAPTGGGTFTVPAFTLTDWTGTVNFFAGPSDRVVLSAVGETASYTLNAGTHIARVELYGGEANDILNGSAGEDSLYGGGGNDTIYVGGGYDEIFAGAGDDLIYLGAGPSYVSGDAGRDTATYQLSTAAVGVDLLTPGLGGPGGSGDGAGDILGVEVIVGSNFNDTMSGSSGGDEFWGADGNDALNGRDGNDSLYGGNGSDYLLGDNGNDYLNGGDDNDTLDGGTGADVHFGGNGIDTATYVNATGAILLDTNSPGQNMGDAAGDTYFGIERFIGTSYNDYMTGTWFADTFEGGAGNDFLRGWFGNDSLSGGIGIDNLEGGMGADLLDGGSNFDLVSYGNAGAGVRASLANTAINTGDAAGDVYVGIEGLSGSFFGDDLIGDGLGNMMWGAQGDDVLWGQGGTDELYGNDGDDWLVGGVGPDKLDGSAGTDTVRYSFAATGLRADLQDFWGNSGDAAGDTYYSIENIVGSDRNDVLLGDNGNNEVWGDYGDDHIWGRGGTDYVAGGNGLDTFHFNTGWGYDVLLDYKIGGAEKLSFDGVSGLTSFSQLTLTDTTEGMNVAFGGNTIVLLGIHSLAAGDCLFT